MITPTPPRGVPCFIVSPLMFVPAAGCSLTRNPTPGNIYFMLILKVPVTKTVGGGGFKTDITHERVSGIFVNIPTKAFCPPMCILFVSRESCFYTLVV